MTLIIAWLGLAVVISWAAQSRGRDRVNWFAFAVVASPLVAGIALALLPDLRRVDMQHRQHEELLAALRSRDGAAPIELSSRRPVTSTATGYFMPVAMRWALFIGAVLGLGYIASAVTGGG